MGDFSFLSDDDSDTEKAVDDLLEQAMDHSVLQQIAAINCSGFNDSSLPSHLETRFRKLKSLPAAHTTPKPSSFTRNSRSFCSSEFPKNEKNCDENKKFEGSSVGEKGGEVNLEDGFVENDVFSKKQEGERGKKSNSSPDSGSFCSSELPNTPKIKKLEGKGSEVNLEDWFVEKQTRSKDVLSKTPDGKRGKKSKASSDSWNFSQDCLSPPTKTGCFWCSPKKGSSKKGKENRSVSMGLKWGKDDELLSDLSTFSLKNQEKLMKKAMEEQEKVNREAEKIVKWAKQASARMDVLSIEDELSDDVDAFK
ncbi:putative seven transmembrane domain-containing tyrosine-protein kinase 1-like [Capsicum annuum]|uniref:uncharacterized protein LOC107856909 n=1 Tax=Capsicum annuum TaxID=4072 RepID=UPI0007BFBF10|nr:uncharacterized protein LOC107856909 [Capsicum annuum]KAF3614619.1 putative seven transmembrane domain-containing tyrosine-protein kinase 1-like [Capsicum annuum]KAF3661534.1 putative seven transmembrane domain-containing tyrosine-protein kinase 1-like [Capsicum annuum]